MATIYVFYNYTPNTPNGRFFMPKRAQNDFYEANRAILRHILEEVGDGKFLEMGLKTYRAYEEYIDLPTTPALVPHNITYIAIDTGVSVLFYFVDSIKAIPQGYRCYITIDNWGTYISIANITKTRFTRSNVLIDEYSTDSYYIDEIPQGAASKRSYLPFGKKAIQATVRFIAIIELEESTTASGTISRTVPFLFNPFVQPYLNLVGGDGQAQIAAAVEAIQNIYETGDGGKAHITKLYIVTSTAKAYLPTFKTTVYGQKVNVQGLNLSSYIARYEEDYNFINGYFEDDTLFERGYPRPTKFSNLGGDIYIGAKYNALKLPSFVGGYSVKIVYELKPNELSIIITNGADSRDISDSFEIPATANTGTLTSLERVAKGLNLMTNLAGGIFQISAGGAGLISGTAQIGKTLTGINEHRNGMYIPGGSGRITYDKIIKNDGEDYLFFIDVPRDIEPNRGANELRLYGAECNVLWKDSEENLLNYLYRLPQLNASPSESTTFYTFIACSCAVDNVPANAAQEISDNLKNGVQIKFIG